MKGLKLKTAILMACACCIAASATAAGRVATEAWVTNKIAQAIKGVAAPGNYETVSNRAMNVDGNFLSKDGPFVWAGDKSITLLNGWLTLDNSETGGGMTVIGYEGVYSYDVGTASWADIINAANSATRPSAPEVTTALRWRADGTACVVTVAAGGTLTADTSNWTEGQAVMAIITLAEGAGIAQGIELVGYGAWPVGTPFVACCYRIGLTVFVVPSTTL